MGKFVNCVCAMQSVEPDCIRVFFVKDLHKYAGVRRIIAKKLDLRCGQPRLCKGDINAEGIMPECNKWVLNELIGLRVVSFTTQLIIFNASSIAFGCKWFITRHDLNLNKYISVVDILDMMRFKFISISNHAKLQIYT